MVFTGTITNTTMTLTPQDGVVYISIKNQSLSSGAITVAGSLGIGGISSSPLSVAAGEVITVSTGGNVIESLVIICGAGESADIIASQ